MYRGLKKTVSAVLAALIACGVAASSFAADTVYGDVNGDANVDSSDALLVLRHAVGLSVIDSGRKINADVNADGEVNSSDALLILNYAVGSIDRFPADKQEQDKNLTADEALKLYTEVLAKTRRTKPAYRYGTAVKTDGVEVDITGLPASQAGKIEELERQMEQEQTVNTDFHPYLIGANSQNSAGNLLPECGLKNAQNLKEVTCELTEDGNYKIKLLLNDVKNPSLSDPYVKVFGNSEFEDFKKDFEESNSVEGAKVELKSFNVAYKNAYVCCEIDPEEKEFVTLEWYRDFDIDMQASCSVIVKIADVHTKMTRSVQTKCDRFDYLAALV